MSVPEPRPAKRGKPRKPSNSGPQVTAPWLLWVTLWACSQLWSDLPLELRQLFLLTLARASSQRGRRWTLRTLQSWVQEQFGVCYSTQTLRQVIRRLGFRWKKARKLLARANTVARLLFLRRLEPLLEQARQGHLVLAYCDEGHLHCDCDLGYGWGTRGQPLLVHSTSPGPSYKSTFYGFYVLPGAQVHIWSAPWADSEQTILMLERLRQQYPTGRLVLLWDGASYHRSQAVRDKAAQLAITLVALPPYSPDLMPVEALWRWLRQEVTGNYCHRSIAELLDRVAAFAADISLDPDTIATRLALKTSLDPQEEELRISNWL